jgi:hypothetical protein
MVSVFRFVEDDAIEQVSELWFNVHVYWNLTCVNNTHVHSILNGVIQEDGMHGISQLVKSSESETEVGKTARDMASWALILHSENFGSINEVLCVVVVFRHTSGNGKDVDIKDNILRVESNLINQDTVSSLADSDLILNGSSLTLLIESHDDNSSSIKHDFSGVLLELIFTTLEGDTVDNALSLAVLKTSFNDLEL